jgi:rhomboid protease GluP
MTRSPPHPRQVALLIDQLRARRRLIPTTFALIVINVGVFAAMLGFGAGLWHSPNSVQLAWGANFGPATQDGQWWRLASAMFIHFGAIHLALNMWALWDGGQFVERLYGSLRFVVLYAASGLAGNLMSLAIHGSHAVSGGASGAIFGVFGALLIALWNERQQLHAAEFKWLFWGAAGFAVASIFLGTAIAGVDNAAHVGGLTTGTLLGIALYRPFLAPRRTDRAVRLTALGVVALGSVFLIGNLPRPSYRWSDEVKAREGISRFLQQESAVDSEWAQLTAQKRQGDLTFEQLAARIDTDIGERYERSFAELSSIPISPGLPSAQMVRVLREYADIRREQSRTLADGIREDDGERLDKARELGKEAEILMQRIGGMAHNPGR